MRMRFACMHMIYDNDMICLTSECISREHIMCLYYYLQLYADNGRLGLRGALLLLSMELLAERVIVSVAIVLRVMILDVSVN